MRKPVIVTHEEVQQAIAWFRSRGGLIHKLPDQPAVRDCLVHERRDASRNQFTPAAAA